MVVSVKKTTYSVICLSDLPIFVYTVRIHGYMQLEATAGARRH